MMTQVIDKMASKLPRVMIYIDPQLKKDAEKLAELDKRSLSNFINVVLQEVVDQAKAEGKIPNNNSEHP